MRMRKRKAIKQQINAITGAALSNGFCSIVDVGRKRKLESDMFDVD